MTDRNAVLFANDAFYAAFFHRDFQAMADIWSKTANISCTHPGWSTLYGRDDVLKSWRGILSNVNAPKIKHRVEHVEIIGDIAIVNCIEDLGDRQYLVATNVLVRNGHVWSMLHHHAGPANVDPSAIPAMDDDLPGPMN